MELRERNVILMLFNADGRGRYIVIVILLWSEEEHDVRGFFWGGIGSGLFGNGIRSGGFMG